MKKRSLFKALAAMFVAGIAALGGGGSADASSFITQTFYDPPPSGAPTLTLPFTFAANANTFDTTLGTLTSVVVTVTTNLAGQVDVISLNVTPPAGATSSFSNAGDQTNVTVTGPGLLATYVAQTSSVSGTVNNPTPTQVVTVTPFSGLTGSTSDTTTITGAGLLAYEKPPSGNTVTLHYAASASSVYGTGDPGTAFSGSATAGAKIVITYNYLAAVPEPASMSLLGIGMAGFFAFRRFFNKRNADV
jgi:hypothetical protein